MEWRLWRKMVYEVDALAFGASEKMDEQNYGDEEDIYGRDDRSFFHCFQNLVTTDNYKLRRHLYRINHGLVDNSALLLLCFVSHFAK